MPSPRTAAPLLFCCLLATAAGVLAPGCEGASLARVGGAAEAGTAPECEGVPAQGLEAVYAAHLASTVPTGCASAGCHGPGSGDFTFSTPQELWAASVEQPSTSAPERRRVVPGRPLESELYLRLLASAEQRMPQGGPYLDEAALREVAGWICAGAPAPAPADGGTPPTGNPVPRLDALAPASVPVGTGATQVELTGEGFLEVSEVLVDGVALAATWRDGGRLQVQLPPALTASSGSFPVQVRNPAPGGGTSAERPFSVTNPTPVLEGLSPTPVAVGGAPFSLSLRGTGFVADSRVLLDGSAVTSRLVADGLLQADMPTFDTPGTHAVQVENPGPGGGTSQTLTLTAESISGPTVTGLSPSPAAAGASFSLTVTGSGYACAGPSSSVVLLEGQSLVPGECSSTRLLVAAPALEAGEVAVQVRNPTGELSNTLALTVAAANPVPVLTALSPGEALAGGAALTLVATGTDFVPGAVLSFAGRTRPTTVVSATRVEAALSSSDIAQAGDFPVRVENPAPGGGSSAALSFAVRAPHPVPSIDALSPCGTVAGAGPLTVVVTGTGFVSGVSATFGGTSVPATFVSATEVHLGVPATLLASAPASRALSVVLTNPAPGGGAGEAFTFGLAGRAATLAADVQPIFTASCASAGCHSANSANGLSLVSGDSYDALVGVPSSGCSPGLRVRACDATRAGSVLVDKILATRTSPACAGTPMPKSGSLTTQQTQAILDWVARGAPR